MTGQIERHAAPARADVESRLAGLDEQFRCDMPFLGELRLVEGHVRPLEIGAGILPVVIEE